MAKVSTNIGLDADLKKSAQERFADFGLDLTTAITMFLKQADREQRIPFEIKREIPNQQTVAALAEYEEMKQHPENYKRYSTFQEALNEVLADA